MPRGDRTGPRGMGPMSGRGAGYCAGYTEPGFVTTGFQWGRGGGRGMGRGCGWRHRNVFYATGVPGWQRGTMPGATAPVPGAPSTTSAEVVDALKQQVRYLEETLTQLKQRIAAMTPPEDDEGKDKS